MSVEQIAHLVSTVGFPIFMVLWLLLRSDKILLGLTEAIRELTAELRREKR